MEGEGEEAEGAGGVVTTGGQDRGEIEVCCRQHWG